MKILNWSLLLIISATLISCDVSNDDNSIETPESYTFTRNGESTVAFPGQTTRIMMAGELVSSMKGFDTETETTLLRKFRNEGENGEDVNPYSNQELNEASKSVKSKVAASEDYFSANTAVSAEIKADFESWISAQVEEVFPNENVAAEAGVAGQIADGSSTRYVNAKGFEYNQMVAKSLIGALMTDQILNNYISTSVLDAGTNREDNSNGVTAEGKVYTNMEHKWDEAYGYLFGNAPDAANPLTTLGNDDGFLNKYLARVDSDEDFAGIAQDVFDAFALGRAAIVEGDYELRDKQAQILREKISTVIAVRAIYYLQSGKAAIEAGDMGAAFHDLSEGFGFVYSLQFTRVPNTGQPYFTKSEVDGFLDTMTAGNGLWDVSVEDLDSISAEIASEFSFSLEAAAN